MDETLALVTQAFGVFKEFRDVGLLLGLAALVNLLVNVTKVPLVEKWLSGVKPVRALVALVLGAAGGLTASLVQGQGLEQVVLMTLGGALAGGGAVTVHELVQALKTVWHSVKARFGF